MTEVVIEVQGGMVVATYADGEALRITVVDWDLKQFGDGSPDACCAEVVCTARLSEMEPILRGQVTAAHTAPGGL